MSEREQAADPYTVRLEPGEEVVREGWALRYDRLGYHGGTGFSTDPLLAGLDSRIRAPSYGSKAEPVHITVIRTPERRELVEFDEWAEPSGATASKNMFNWRPIKLIPGTERAVVRRLVPGPVVETP